MRVRCFLQVLFELWAAQIVGGFLFGLFRGACGVLLFETTSDVQRATGNK